MDKKDITSLIERWNKLKSERQPWERTWQELSDYIVPRKAAIFSGVPATGGKERRKVVTGRPEYYANVLSSTFGGLLTNPASQWFQLKVRDFDASQDVDSQRWLETVERTVFSVFLNSNFSQEISEVYLDLVTLGTAALYVEEDNKDVARFSARSVAECFISEDFKGSIDTNLRHFKMTLRNALEQFPDTLPDKHKRRAEKNPDDMVDVLHAVYRRANYNPDKKRAKDKPFASVWILIDDKIVLKESGYDEFPWAIARFTKVTPEIYGRGPGSIALPTIKHVNDVEITTIKARQLETLPPLLAREDNLMTPVKLQPGGITFVRDLDAAPRPLNAGAQSQIGDAQVDAKMREIAEAFFYDIILTQDAKTPRTATEIMQRTDERSRMLVSALSRIQYELLNPLIERVIGICARRGLFPEPSEAIKGALSANGHKLEIAYTSPLAKAQVVHDANAIMRTVEALLPLQQMGVDALAMFDMDEAARIVAEAYGVPARALLSKDKLAQMRKAQQEQAAQAQQANSTQQMVGMMEQAARAEQATANTNGPVKQALKALGDQFGQAA